ncbi:unnamed protein product [Cuscuta campestris]|uniref:DDE Tnp4 domain-containing protein n=1 Tax=Cuscuta campestris TaxID=132261 RepID=A0A484L044_9ASTE|nr:unnamed protein product [Cuscuta campestris]
MGRLLKGNGTATCMNAIGLGNDTDATILQVEEEDEVDGENTFKRHKKFQQSVEGFEYNSTTSYGQTRVCTIHHQREHKDCVGAIDDTHIPAMVVGREVSSYRNRHGTISQNVLAVCNFDLQFIYVLSGWEGFAHDSKVLNDALSRPNGLKVPSAPDEDTTNETDESYEWDDTQTQDQQQEKANEWRLNLANEMWATTNSENS